MRFLYRLQQRLAITTPEATALLFVAAVLLVGITAQHLDAQRTPFGPDHYAALHDTLAARSAPADSAEAGSAAAAAPARARWSRSAKAGPVRMDLNTASEQELQRLPRIGPRLAERIVAYREMYGPFARPAHVVRVRGIGPKTFEQLEPYLFVGEDGFVGEDEPGEGVGEER